MLDLGHGNERNNGRINIYYNLFQRGDKITCKLRPQGLRILIRWSALNAIKSKRNQKLKHTKIKSVNSKCNQRGSNTLWYI